MHDVFQRVTLGGGGGADTRRPVGAWTHGDTAHCDAAVVLYKNKRGLIRSRSRHFKYLAPFLPSISLILYKALPPSPPSKELSEALSLGWPTGQGWKVGVRCAL